MMADVDASILPVGDGDRLVGMTTDRDIAVRGRGGQGPTDTGTRGDVERGQVLLRGWRHPGCRPQYGRDPGPPPARHQPRQATYRDHRVGRHRAHRGRASRRRSPERHLRIRRIVFPDRPRTNLIPGGESRPDLLPSDGSQKLALKRPCPVASIMASDGDARGAQFLGIRRLPQRHGPELSTTLAGMRNRASSEDFSR